MGNSNIGESKMIKLFSDTPVKEDKLGSHDAIASTIKNIITTKYSNDGDIRRPFVIGLFGKWGSGKSSIINMLAERSKKLFAIIEVDAWSVGKNNFLRHVVLSCAEQLDIVDEKHKAKIISDIKKEDQIEEVTWKPGENARLIGLIFTLVIVVVVALSIWNWLADWKAPLDVITPAILVVITMWFINFYLPKHSKKTTKSSIDLFANDPRYFRDELLKVINSYKRYDIVCLVIDNIDRLPPKEAVYILGKIKTFVIEEEVFTRLVFVVPCDPEQIVGEISRIDSQYSTLTRPNAILRKFFNVVVNIPQPILADLQKFTSNLLIKSDIDFSEKDIAEITSLIKNIYSNNPREVKQFVNNLIVHYFLAVKLEDEGKITPKITSNMPLFSFFLILLNELRGEEVPKSTAELEASIEKIKDNDNKDSINSKTMILKYADSMNLVWKNTPRELWVALYYFKSANDALKFDELKRFASLGLSKEFISKHNELKPNNNDLINFLISDIDSKIDIINTAKVIFNSKSQGIQFNLPREFITKIIFECNEDANIWYELPSDQLYKDILRSDKETISLLLNQLDSSISTDEEKLYEEDIKLNHSQIEQKVRQILSNILEDNEALSKYKNLENIINTFPPSPQGLSGLVLGHAAHDWTDDTVEKSIEILDEMYGDISLGNVINLFMDGGNSRNRPPMLVGNALNISASKLVDSAGEDGKRAINQKSNKIVKSLLNSIKSGVLEADSGKIQECFNNLNSSFMSLDNWNDVAELLSFEEMIIGLPLSGVDKNPIQNDFTENMNYIIEELDTEDALKGMRKFKLAIEEFNNDKIPSFANLNERLFKQALKSFPRKKLDILNQALSEHYEWIANWLGKGGQMSIETLTQFQDGLLPQALLDTTPDEDYCSILSLLPIKKGSEASDNRKTAFDNLIGQYPSASEDHILNIIKAFIWSKQTPTQDQLKIILEQKKKMDMSVASKEFKPTWKQFNKLIS